MRRQKQLERIIELMTILNSQRFQTLTEINQSLPTEYQSCERTTYRDLQTMIGANMIGKTKRNGFSVYFSKIRFLAVDPV